MAACSFTAAACSASAWGIWCGASTQSATPASRAVFGMPSNWALSVSCTITRPPASCTSRMPREPSLPPPESTIATARAPQSCASERKKMSIGSDSSCW
ncbi:MAG: hypothetical protein QM723_31940 [Myxococcaceae bacterium]